MTSALIENPTDLERIASVHRFFIYGINEVADRLQMLICGRFPYRFMGFLYNQKTNERGW